MHTRTHTHARTLARTRRNVYARTYAQKRAHVRIRTQAHTLLAHIHAHAAYQSPETFQDRAQSSAARDAEIVIFACLPFQAERDEAEVRFREMQSSIDQTSSGVQGLAARAEAAAKQVRRFSRMRWESHTR
eukprot:6208057-Pleurochrysis_carterae.AAC.1